MTRQIAKRLLTTESRGYGLASMSVAKADGQRVNHYVSLQHVPARKIIGRLRRRVALNSLVESLLVAGKINEVYIETPGHKERRRYA